MISNIGNNFQILLLNDSSVLISQPGGRSGNNY